MFAFAARAFRLAKAGKDGVTERAKLEHIWNQTGVMPEDLELPDLPDQAEHVWSWFQDLSEGRSRNSMGPSPLSWMDIHSWCSFKGLSLLPEELRMIRAMDRAWLSVFAVQKN